LDRSKIVLGGHSQGAVMAAADAFIGGSAAWKNNVPGQPLLAVASNASGYNKLPPTPSTFLYESFFDRVPATPITRFRAVSHTANNHQGRLQFLSSLGVPGANVREISNQSPECVQNAHNCTISDSDTPLGADGTPVFLKDWIWLACGGG
jgi:hypothetical protein